MCPFISPSCGQSPGLKGVCLVAVLSDFRRFYEIIFFWKDRPQTEGSRHTDHGIKTPPAYSITIDVKTKISSDLEVGGLPPDRLPKSFSFSHQ